MLPVSAGLVKAQADTQPSEHGSMESTGVYWKPIFNLLEGQVEVVLANRPDVARAYSRHAVQPVGGCAVVGAWLDAPLSAAPMLHQRLVHPTAVRVAYCPRFAI